MEVGGAASFPAEAASPPVSTLKIDASFLVRDSLSVPPLAATAVTDVLSALAAPLLRWSWMRVTCSSFAAAILACAVGERGGAPFGDCRVAMPQSIERDLGGFETAETASKK